MTSLYDWSTTPASNATVGSINFAENQNPSTVNDSARQLMADVALWLDTVGPVKISTGTDTIALTSGLSLSAYAQGQVFCFEAGGANTGAATLNVDTIGAKSIVKHYNVALAANDIVAGGIYKVAYEATADNFQLISPASNAPLTSADTASDTAAGIVELATTAETNTGTDTGRVVTPDGLAGSNFGTAVVPLIVFDDGTDCATGNGAGDIWFRVPSTLNGMDLVGVAACCQTAGTTGTMDIQIHNVTQAADMLSTVITIDSTETDSSTAATPAVIDTANDDVATGDQIRIDVDAVHTTAAKGLLVELQFRLP